MTSVCMVNDCSHVAGDLCKWLSLNYDVSFVKRTRGLYDKTVGLWWKIRGSDADLYHVHYALQDAWLVDKLRRLDVLHCHGSDVRDALHSPVWGRVVRGNLTRARHVFYSTPDLTAVKRFRPDAEYLPTPVDTSRFYPYPYEVNGGNLKALYFNKWYEQPPRRIVELCRKHGVELHMRTANVPYERMPALLNSYDVYVDRFSIASLSKTALEAMACGCNVVAWNTSHIEDEFAPRNTRPENLEYVRSTHDSERVASQVSTVYKELQET